VDAHQRCLYGGLRRGQCTVAGWVVAVPDVAVVVRSCCIRGAGTYACLAMSAGVVAENSWRCGWAQVAVRTASRAAAQEAMDRFRQGRMSASVYLLGHPSSEPEVQTAGWV